MSCGPCLNRLTSHSDARAAAHQAPRTAEPPRSARRASEVVLQLVQQRAFVEVLELLVDECLVLGVLQDRGDLPRQDGQLRLRED